MSFTPSEFWKNFRLGTELSISGNFIYNGLYCFELMPHFYNEDETFEFLYNISVGIERLQKICIILIEHNEEDNQHEFQKSLISHNHSDLHARIIKNKTINLGKSHLKFLSTLTKFYKSSRYSKFQIDSVYEQNTSKTELIKFIEESLEIDISIDMMNCTENDLKIKQFIGKTIGKFCKEYYNIVKAECHKLNIYTYEIPPDSKAFKIFMSEKFDFGDEKIIQKEILKFLIQTKLPVTFKDYLFGAPALELESFEINQYIEYLFSYHKEYSIKGEIEELYSEIKDKKSRFNYLDAIGNPYTCFEKED